MEETMGPVFTCGRELLHGWWRLMCLMVFFYGLYSFSTEYFEYHVVYARIVLKYVQSALHIVIQNTLGIGMCDYKIFLLRILPTCAKSWFTLYVFHIFITTYVIGFIRFCYIGVVPWGWRQVKALYYYVWVLCLWRLMVL
jgi:hypothetical protein